MNAFSETKFIMKKYNITANKNYGQNFLIDDDIIAGIVENANVTSEDLIIEIGPGLGTLTAELLKKAGKVISIELDPKMINILNDRFSLYENFELINQDVLKVDLNTLIDSNLESSKLKNAKVVANLPYYITTPIIMKLLEEKLNLKSITVMVQREVALRLAAKPGDKETGAITYSINYYTEPKIVLDVPNNSFIPAPEVHSAVIKLDILTEPRVKLNNEDLFFDVIKSAFLQKRKTLVNALNNSKLFNNKTEILKMLDNLNIDQNIRGEKLSIEEYALITDYIEKTKAENK
ncbi:MAG: 16S rRNA (adenine(1518)-N(6)/adenine(1519)-N(6))-dimethyltransferase RsmA [Clostridia bacterium]|nr:16S rRNA (adenine(1518)-N(6)/adenine(1519)-N(6))-dimethyltransferase RsmA [Clostridia bacterium]